MQSAIRKAFYLSGKDFGTFILCVTVGLLILYVWAREAVIAAGVFAAILLLVLLFQIFCSARFFIKNPVFLHFEGVLPNDLNSFFLAPEAKRDCLTISGNLVKVHLCRDEEILAIYENKSVIEFPRKYFPILKTDGGDYLCLEYKGGRPMPVYLINLKPKLAPGIVHLASSVPDFIKLFPGIST